MSLLDATLVDWSRAQFAMTAMYHWLFVPLTLGLGLIVCIMESIYVKTGNEDWKKATKFWMTLFGINFAIGVATGIILEFEFGTNWSNYSWFVGDIFGAPLAIEGILAFFLEATFISIMFFGWNKVGKKFHLASTWLTVFGASISALWILVANAWMQYPVGMQFNPDTVRNEMVDFWSVISPLALNKYFHTITSGWVVGSLFVAGVSSWYLIKKRNTEFAIRSIKLAAIVGLASSILVATTGDTSGYHVAQKQPMKLAAMEGLYTANPGGCQGLVAFGILNPNKKEWNDTIKPFLFKVEIPGALSFLANRDFYSYVPGITNIMNATYDGGKALSFETKQAKGKLAIQALADYQKAVKENRTIFADSCKKVLEANYPYFGYGYIKEAKEMIPNVPLVFYSFHIMVALGGYFILLFAFLLIFVYRKNFTDKKWIMWITLVSIPLGYLAGQFGWVVAEVGRQPWAIQDVLPLKAAISNISSSSVMLTFFLFLILFSVLLIAEIRIMLKQIKSFQS